MIFLVVLMSIILVLILPVWIDAERECRHLKRYAVTRGGVKYVGFKLRRWFQKKVL